MSDILTIALQAIYRTTSTATPDWSTEAWSPYVMAPNSGEINKFSVSFPTTFVYDISHYLSSLVMMIKNTSSSGFFVVQWNDGLNLSSQLIRAGNIALIPAVSSGTALTFISAGGTQTFIMALAAA